VDFVSASLAAKQFAILLGVPHMEITSKTDVLVSMIAGFLTAADASKSGSVARWPRGGSEERVHPGRLGHALLGRRPKPGHWRDYRR